MVTYAIMKMTGVVSVTAMPLSQRLRLSMPTEAHNEARIKELEVCLSWYADIINFTVSFVMTEVGTQSWRQPEILNDRGQRAREVLGRELICTDQ